MSLKYEPKQADLAVVLSHVKADKVVLEEGPTQVSRENARRAYLTVNALHYCPKGGREGSARIWNIMEGGLALSHTVFSSL